MKKNYLICIMCLLISTAYSEMIELKTGSQFQGEILNASPRGIVVKTDIGILKLTCDMLSKPCVQRILKNVKGVPAEKDSAVAETKESFKNVDISVDFTEKTIDRDKERFRHIKKETVEKVGEIKVKITNLPTDNSHVIRVEYVFMGVDARGIKRPFDRGTKKAAWEPRDADPEITIESRSVTHVETEHTGDTLRQRGMKIVGYTVNVYIDNKLVTTRSE